LDDNVDILILCCPTKEIRGRLSDDVVVVHPAEVVDVFIDVLAELPIANTGGAEGNQTGDRECGGVGMAESGHNRGNSSTERVASEPNVSVIGLADLKILLDHAPKFFGLALET